MIRIHAIRATPKPPKAYDCQGWKRHAEAKKLWRTAVLRVEMGRVVNGLV